MLDHVAARVAQVQDVLGRRLLLENATAYVAFAGAQLDEGSFFAALCARTGCGVLLDVDNLYVNARNLGRVAAPILGAIPEDAVGYMHLAGHAALADVWIDTHGTDVPDAVWNLYEIAAQRFPQAGVIIERDDDLPAFFALAAEANRARATPARHRARRGTGSRRGSRRSSWPARRGGPRSSAPSSSDSSTSPPASTTRAMRNSRRCSTTHARFRPRAACASTATPTPRACAARSA